MRIREEHCWQEDWMNKGSEVGKSIWIWKQEDLDFIVNVITRLCQFPMAALTNYNKLGV